MRSTSPGRRSPLPVDSYEAPERISVDGGVTSMSFSGNDNRTKTYSTASWGVPELHAGIVGGIASATGYAGSCRTERSASNLWTYSRRFVNHLAALPSPPRSIQEITAAHLRGYEEHLRNETATDSGRAQHAMRVLRIVFSNIPTEHPVGADVLSYLSARRSKPNKTGVSGFSDDIFQQLVTAARADVVAIRTRVRSGRALARRYETDPDTVPEPLRRLAQQLAELLRTGRFTPAPGEPATMQHKLSVARHVFVMDSDLTPMLILFALMSGRNSETLKELPADHQVLQDGVLRFQVIKRRQGMDHWFEDVHWEVGKPSRQLHTPGGIFALYDELCEPGRAHAGTDRLWAIWANPRRSTPNPNRFPWAASLQAHTPDLGGWVRRHGIEEDGGALHLSFNRIRTTYLRRQVRGAGGHLPSVKTQNTQDVLFSNYLAGDSTVRSWADREIAATFSELETQIREGRTTALISNGGRIASVDELVSSADEAAYLGCKDIRHGPHTPGSPCGASALACFSCPNALVGAQHLPKIMHLKSELEARWARMGAARWWARYGAAWIAINDDILPRFTDAELADISPDPTVELKFLEDAA
jgi:hypothetical protein